MLGSIRSRLAFSLAFSALTFPVLAADPPATPCWNVDDLKVGQKGYGVTVMKGVTREKFDAEVLGVLKNTSPGRDMVLCRLSGLNLERTGVIAGMSGSPVYIEGKLLGAVAYAWAYGKEPIAGVTPFSQMRSFADSFERHSVSAKSPPVRIGLSQPVQAGGQSYTTVTVSANPTGPKLDSDESLCMVPLRAPLAASGFSSNSLRMLREQFPELGLTPVQGGTVAAKVAEDAKDTEIAPGAALTVALIEGDFDMSGIGTVTHVEGKRVYGWGHPFMSLGGCELPLMTGWVHTVYPRQTVSFKMGSPLKTVGTINADVSTGIAGWIGREPDMLPVSMKVRQEPGGDAHTFKVRIARQKQILPALIYTALTNSIDMEGDLPEEMTISFTCRIDIDDKEPIVIKDTFAGTSYSGSKAPSSLYTPITQLVSQLLNFQGKPLRIARIDCETEIRPGRDSAEIEGLELSAETYAPGETVQASVFVRPHRGRLIKVPVSLKLPADLPEGVYPLTVTDELTGARQELRNRPHLVLTQDEDRMLEAVRLLTSAKRSNLVARLPLPATGVAMEGKALTDLPPSVVQILGQSRRSPVLPVAGSLVGKEPTAWTLYGSETVRVTVSRTKRAAVPND